MDVHFQMFKRGNGYHPWMFNFTVDICRFLRKPYNPFGIILFKAGRHFTNFNHSCPYMGDQIVDGLHVDYKALQVPIPSGEYLLEITWIFNKRPQLITNVYVTIKED
ncbi:CG33796 [Drosophila busckii]|uniref:CG33796 n=1 Tax=Drosophila busckii TaxID=30019 RepID=A0A0M4EUR6_DROBS|nr:CG33796 [Drosophila busckii]